MLHSIASLTNAALAIVGEIWTAARDRTVPWNAHLILDRHVCDVTEVQQNRPQEEPPHGEGECLFCHKVTHLLVDSVCDECWQKETSWNEGFAEDRLHVDLPDPRDEDPRFRDPFARPDWNGDPNEY